MLAAGAVLVVVVAAVACRPLPLGGASNELGNDVAGCPQFQPAQSAPCGPQPMLWASTQGPYEDFANGDPYGTKCARNSTVSPAVCSSGPYPGGATNSLYDPTGYEYAIDVGPADVGVPVALQVWDAGSYPRTVGSNTTTTNTVSMVEGDATLTRSSGVTNFVTGDVGKAISGTGIPPGATIASRISTTQITISAPALSTGTNRTVSIANPSTADCNQSLPPFNAAPYLGSVNTQNCQTGDSGQSPFQLQVFDNDGDDEAVTYDTAITACHVYIPGANDLTGLNASAATFKNKWATVCTFTPTTTGIYPLRVKSSSITLPNGVVIADVGNGYNQFALRLTGATTSKLYGLGALSLYTNTPNGSARFYLAEITTADAGKRLQIDLYDPADGTGGQYTLQVLAPPSGAPGVVPTTGTVIPAPGYADSCRYNSVASPSRGPDVAAPLGTAAPNCQVVTRTSGGSNIYNNNWLSIEIDISPDYVCDTDCWWTVKYDFGGSTGMPTDRTVWSPFVFDKPPAPATTTTTTTTVPEPTTTTTTAPLPIGSPRDLPLPGPPTA